MELLHSPFLYVLKAGLWGSLPEAPVPEDLSDTDWAAFFAQASAHAVDALVSDGAGLLPEGQRPPFQQLAPLAVAVDAIERGNDRVDAVLKSMTAFWEKEGVTAVLLKGQGLAGMYAKPEHRTPGDIDWYFPGNENFQKALALVNDRGVAAEIDGDGDYHYTVNGVVVEHHKGWCNLSSPFKESRIEAVEKEYGYATERQFKTLAPVTNLIQLNIHILKHVLVMGIGWRQLCDLAVAYKYYYGHYSAQDYQTEIARLRLTRWTKLLNGVLVNYLGAKREWMPLDAQSGADVDRLADIVMQSGNFGRESGRGKMGSIIGKAGLLGRYAFGELFWRPVSLGWNRSFQLFERKKNKK